MQGQSDVSGTISAFCGRSVLINVEGGLIEFELLEMFTKPEFSPRFARRNKRLIVKIIPIFNLQ